jgi:AcrR family transcriptional regulator
MGSYTLKARAAGMGRTRQRIVEATLRLHTTVGPARTSIAAVAEEAGVQRHTVYSHFPDEKALFAACGGLFGQRNPYPAVEPWRQIEDPARRVHHALAEVYSYFRAHERVLWPVVRDVPLIPHLVGRGFAANRAAATAAIMAGWKLRGVRAARSRAVVDLALRFETWRALTTDGELNDDDATAAMSKVILCAAGLVAGEASA